jgi:hypothetical protein
LEASKVRVEKKTPQKLKRIQGQQPKKVNWYSSVELTQGQELDEEETQPILWTEPPTGALVGASSL